MNAVLQVPPPLATLHALLDEGRARWSPEYRDRLVSHLPMAQQALWALGADAAQLQRFSAAQLEHLEPLPWRWQAPARLPDWSALRGRIDEMPRLLAHFDAMLREDGVEATLDEALPALLDSAGTMAFHALIRLGHALQAAHDDETALALAYWAARHQPLHAAHLPPGDLELGEWLDAVRALPAPATPPRGGLISDRMSAWALAPGFAALASGLKVSDAARTLHALAEWLAGAYAASGSFTLLHGLTASRAMKVLLPRLRPADVQAFAFDLAAALRASGWSGSPGPPGQIEAQWGAWMRAARAQDDAHVVKLVHACADWAGLLEAACGPVTRGAFADAAARALGN